MSIADNLGALTAWLLASLDVDADNLGALDCLVVGKLDVDH